jgi:hypothetical protein
MSNIVSKPFDTPDTTRTPDKAKVEVVNLGDVNAARMTLQPGWKWSECIRPIVGGDSCQVRHIGAVSAGRLRVSHDDGTEIEIGPGEAYLIEPGHDAEVVSDEAFVGYEFESNAAATYATTGD